MSRKIFSWFSKDKQKSEDVVNTESVDLKKEENQKDSNIFQKFVKGLKKTRSTFSVDLFSLFKGRKIDDELFEEIETTLLSADVGIETTTKLINKITEEVAKKDLKNSDVLFSELSSELHKILSKVSVPLIIDNSKKPFVILMVGVNGVGKTTTIGKMAKLYKNKGLKVMLAAGDTFRAAAVEQLKEWGDRNNVPVVHQDEGADSASVIYDAYLSAKAKGFDVVIADTAGRLQNKANLMEELRKIVRVLKKIDESAPHEVMLTVDACSGQNVLNQVKIFNSIVEITGINITKLDGTAKGGIIFNVADSYNIPLRYIGVGEGDDDLKEFDADNFIKAIFSVEDGQRDD